MWEFMTDENPHLLLNSIDATCISKQKNWILFTHEDKANVKKNGPKIVQEQWFNNN